MGVQEVRWGGQGKLRISGGTDVAEAEEKKSVLSIL